MKKKKIILIIAIVVCVAVAGTLAAVRFLRKPATPAAPTPLAQTIQTDSAAASSQAAAEIELGEPVENDSLILFGTKYYAVTQQSAEQYTDTQGVVSPAKKVVKYYDKDKETLLYIGETVNGILSLTDADGKLLYRMSDYVPENTYDSDPVSWFYANGTVVLGEQCFYDENTENAGVAYYNADGSLLCVRTEVYTAEKDGSLACSYYYYNSTYEAITEDAFYGLLPAVDAKDFLYLRWS